MSDDEPRDDAPEGAAGSDPVLPSDPPDEAGGGDEDDREAAPGDGDRDSLSERALDDDWDEADEDYEGVDELDVRDALRKALRVSAPDTVKITRGVQDRIRDRSAGRYFADGWSTSSAPHATYLVTTLLMLLLVLAAWWLLGPVLYTLP